MATQAAGGDVSANELSHAVEFIGGPLDGDVMDLPREYMDWNIPLASPTQSVCAHLIDALTIDAWKPADFRTGFYRRDGRNPRHMIWQGER